MIIVYSTNTCPFCTTLKERLKKNNIPFAVFDDEDYMENVLKFDEIPVMEVEENVLLPFADAMKWIKHKEEQSD